MPHSHPIPYMLRENILTGNALWFLLLGGLSLLLIAYTFWRKRDPKLLALYLGLGAIAGYFENVVCIWLESYEYYPHILKDPYLDIVLGTYLSQVYYVTSVALFITAFHLRFRWALVFAGMFVGIEYGFLALGIYKLNWWHPGYTFIGLLLFFWISNKWYRLIQIESSRFVRWFTLVGINYILYGNVTVLPFFNHNYRFVGGFFELPERDTVTVLIIFMLVRGVIVATVCFYRLHWAILASVPIAIGAGILVLTHAHILTFKYEWCLWLFTSADTIVLICCFFFNRILSSRHRHPH
ncbi:hypothetical protein [Paenibacillus soyae]|uniref:Uncharacterized protein n=1 Tax=Paenibacillus soyae TaxID=2969249 RepID=A0A9X2MNX8_9BACL|nr:hypothetical protein [Paenibacillus soyae]MCR2805468.1 hypothetical protein [Paenibacillus soyae]